MSLHLVTAETTEELFSHFYDNFRPKSPAQLFKPLNVVIPNLNITRYLELEIAARAKTTLGYRFIFLEKAIQLIAGALPGVVDADLFGQKVLPLRTVNRTEWQVLIYALLATDCPAWYKTYLYGPNHDQFQENRAYGLSQKLAVLFQNYLYHYPEIINAFTDKKKEKGTDVFSAQKLLYTRSVAWAETFNYVAPENYITILEKSIQNNLSRLPENPLVLFTPGYLSGYHLKILKIIAEKTDVHFYSLRLNTQKDQTLYAPLLEWSRPAERFYAVFKNIFRDQFTETHKAQETAAPSPKQLAKILAESRCIFFTAPGIWREIETIADLILYYADKYSPDQTFTLNDIALLCPDVGKYRAAIEYVFAERNIPWNLTDTSAAKTSRLSGTLSRIGDLIENNFARITFFDFLSDLFVMHAFGYDYAMAEQMISFLENHSYRNSPPSATETEKPYTLEYILERACRARIIRPVYHVGKNRVAEDIFHEIQPADDCLETLLLISETMLSFRKTCQADNIPAETLVEFLGKCIQVPQDQNSEHIVFQKLLSDIGAIYEPYATRQVAVSFKLWRKLLEDHLTDIPMGRGKYLSGGVSVSSLLPMRPVPFRIMFLAGMTEGEFPGRLEISENDLRMHADFVAQKHRLNTDFSTRELAQNLFTEILLSVRDELILSCQSRDIVKDTAKEPNEYMRSVLQWASTYHDSQVNLVHIPLQTFHDSYYSSGPLLPEAFRKFHQKKLQSGKPDNSDSRLDRYYPKRIFAKSFSELSVHGIVLFLRNPEQFAARELLKLQNLSRRYENFDFEYSIDLRNSFVQSNLVSYMLQNALFIRPELSPQETEDLLSTYYAQSVQIGQAGSGEYAKMAFEDLRDEALEAFKNLQGITQRHLRGSTALAVVCGGVTMRTPPFSTVGRVPRVFHLPKTEIHVMHQSEKVPVSLTAELSNIVIHENEMQVFTFLSDTVNVKPQTVILNMHKSRITLQVLVNAAIAMVGMSQQKANHELTTIEKVTLVFLGYPREETENARKKNKQQSYGYTITLDRSLKEPLTSWLETIGQYMVQYGSNAYPPLLDPLPDQNIDSWKSKLTGNAAGLINEYTGRDVTIEKTFSDPELYFARLTNELMGEYFDKVYLPYKSFVEQNAEVMFNE